MAFLGMAALLSGWAALGFLQGNNALNRVAIAGLLVLAPITFALRLRSDPSGPRRVSPIGLILIAGISALLGHSSIPWPEAALEFAQRSLSLSIPLFCFFLLSLSAGGGGDRKSRMLAVMAVACAALMALGGMSLYRGHSLFREVSSPEALDAEWDATAMADLADRLALNIGEQLEFLEREAGAYQALGNLSEAVRYTIEAQSLREDLRLLADPPPLKKLYPPLWVLVFGCDSTDWFSQKERPVAFSFVKDQSVFWCVSKEGKIWRVGPGDLAAALEPTGGSGNHVAAIRSRDGRWAVLYVSGKIVAGEVGAEARKELRCLTDRGPDVWRDLAAAPGGAWAAISKDGEVRLVKPETDAFENLTGVNESWRDKDVVRRLALLSDGRSGYYVDLFGGIHPFGDTPIQRCHLRGAEARGGPYFEGRDVMVGLTAIDDGRRLIVVDRFGGIHQLTLGADGAVWSGSARDETAGWNAVVDVEYLSELQRLYLLRENGRIEVVKDGRN
jgi:hypothetical protein